MPKQNDNVVYLRSTFLASMTQDPDASPDHDEFAERMMPLLQRMVGTQPWQHSAILMLDGPHDDTCAIYGTCSLEEAALMLSACAAMVARMADENKDPKTIRTLVRMLQAKRTHVQHVINRMMAKKETEE